MENIPKNITATEENGSLIITYKEYNGQGIYIMLSAVILFGLYTMYRFESHMISDIGPGNLLFHFSAGNLLFILMPVFFFLLIIYPLTCAMVNKYIITVNDEYISIGYKPLPIRLRKTKIRSCDIKNITFETITIKFQPRYYLKVIQKNNSEIDLCLYCINKGDAIAIKTFIEKKLNIKH